MIKRTFVLIALLACAGGAVAANVFSAQSGNWTVGSTWQGGNEPTSGIDRPIIDGHFVTVDSALTFTVGGDNLVVGNTQAVTRLTVANTGDFTLGGVLSLGHNATGEVLVDGGRLSVSSTYRASLNATGTTVLQGNARVGVGATSFGTGNALMFINGGFFKTSGTFAPTANTTIDIAGGALILQGEWNDTNFLALNGTITANGAVGPQVFVYDYDSAAHPGFTSITAIPEPATMFLLSIGSLAFVRRRRC